ncbi:hypothetical protein GG344DRAFT_66212, partial [Lentinula edodes]
SVLSLHKFGRLRCILLNSNLTLLGYYERNPPNVPSGTNFNSNISHGNSASRAVVTPSSVISTTIPTNGATSTSTAPLGTFRHVANQSSATLSPNALSGHRSIPNTTPATVQSTLAAHRPIAGRIPQMFNKIPTAVGPSGTTNPPSLNSGLNPVSGSRSNAPYSFNIVTNGIANGTSSFQTTNPSGSLYSFPSSYGNAWPATSDQAFPHQLTAPHFTTSLPGHGQKRRTTDSLENPDRPQNSSSPPMKRMKTLVDTDSLYTIAPSHGPLPHAHHYPSTSGQHHTPFLGATSATPVSLAGASEQHKNPSTSGQSSAPFSSNHVHTPFSGITPAPHEGASEQHKRPSSSRQLSISLPSSHVPTLAGQDRSLPSQITTATQSHSSTPVNEISPSQACAPSTSSAI